MLTWSSFFLFLRATFFPTYRQLSLMTIVEKLVNGEMTTINSRRKIGPAGDLIDGHLVISPVRYRLSHIGSAKVSPLLSQEPLAVDNSGYVPSMTSIPAVLPPARFPVGTHKVTYIAADLKGNEAQCHFYISVKG